MKSRSFRAILLGLCAVAALNCSTASDDADHSAADLSEAEMVDCNDLAGIPGLLPKDDSLTDLENVGRCAWVLGTGRTTDNARFAPGPDGKPAPAGTGGTENLLGDMRSKNGSYVPLPLMLSAKDEPARVQRWKQFGTMNDPSCKAATHPDEFGLQMDDCKDPFSAGVVGFRKFKNPKFDKAKWDVTKYATDKTMEPPYLVGSTCGGCHTSFNPVKPPVDPAHPTWDNLVFTIGNQYFAEGELFKPATGGPKDFRWQVLDTQQRGTSDTSRIPSDHINNPNVINSIYNLAFRPWHGEKLKQGQTTYDLTKVDLVALNKMTFEAAAAALAPIKVARTGEEHPVQSILKGGEDSVGPVGALLRVYVNIGMCSSTWVKHFDPVNGTTKQTPLEPDEVFRECPSYFQMLKRVPAIFLYLAKQGPIYLKDAPNGAAHIDQSLLKQGKQVFAETCARCHSSKQPTNGESLTDIVMKDDFLQNNFLSDDKSYPVTEIGTNAARALHSNHMEGNVWSAAYASQTYAERKWPGTLKIKKPASLPWASDIDFNGPDGGPGYYRTPTLISIWARAPWFHNKSLGIYTGDPSIEGRLKAFDDAATKLLNPDKRGNGFIKVTSQDSVLDLGILGLKVNVAKGTPVNLFANLDPNAMAVKFTVGGAALGELFGGNFDPAAPSLLNGTKGMALLNNSLCPDIVEDHGHEFGSGLNADDKKALTEYLKTL